MKQQQQRRKPRSHLIENRKGKIAEEVEIESSKRNLKSQTQFLVKFKRNKRGIARKD